MASYNKFNYSFRPAKSIERKLLIELLKEIYGVVDARNCTYIGFGSIFFVDFKIIHKELGIKSMINIEENEADRKRFEFNKPFSCISLLWGTSTEILPGIDWSGKKIVWMDYDETLQKYMFDDIETIFTSIESGSFYFFTCNSSLPKYFNKESNDYNITAFQEDFKELTPFNLSGQMLTSNQSPDLIREMLNTQIKHILDQRNSILSNDEKLNFYQLLFLTYKDNAPMFSYGGMILKKSDFSNLRRAGVFSLPYVRRNGDRLNIQTPILTNSEIDLINSHLPKSKGRFLNLRKMAFIPNEEKEKYHSVYRYYPSFVEIRD